MANKEVDQDRVFDTTDHFNRFGFIMFPQNKKCYENIAKRISGKNVFEAGCGMGLGSALLARSAKSLIATDKLVKNVKFAKELYGWINFDVWDMQDDPIVKADVVVCVEAIEHVAHPARAIRHLVLSAKEEVWITTPNNHEENPSNPFHVQEYTVQEMFDMLKNYGEVEIYHWETMAKLDTYTSVSPLIYHVIK